MPLSRGRVAPPAEDLEYMVKCAGKGAEKIASPTREVKHFTSSNS